jgi:hypothetical protein
MADSKSGLPPADGVSKTGASPTHIGTMVALIGAGLRKERSEVRLSLFVAFRNAVSCHDTDGQAPNRFIRGEAVTDRDVDELIGIIKGILADGQVTEDEARFLANWIQIHVAAARAWPARVLYPRLTAALQDDTLTSAEEHELLSLLATCVGYNAPAAGIPSASTALPLTTPEPIVTFQDRRFCFTGSCYSGTREWCEQQVRARGGSIASVSKKLDYLVIGEVGSRDWVHSTHGRKIEKAADYVRDGVPIAIVAERHWHSHLETEPAL